MEILQMIEKKVFTEEALGEVIYSFNKRAKNYRDLKRKEKDVSEKTVAELREKQYYGRKSFMINLLCEPQELHIINGTVYIWVQLGNKNFHIHPAEFCEELKSLKHLPKKSLENFQTNGEKEENLVSEDLANKIYEIIESLDFKVA